MYQGARTVSGPQQVYTEGNLSLKEKKKSQSKTSRHGREGKKEKRETCNNITESQAINQHSFIKTVTISGLISVPFNTSEILARAIKTGSSCPPLLVLSVKSSTLVLIVTLLIKLTPSSIASGQVVFMTTLIQANPNNRSPKTPSQRG